MAITTYSALQTAIADFLNRDDLTSVIPTFIELCEADLNRKVRHWRQEKRVSQTLDTQYSELPADFLQAIRYYITSDNTSPLELISQGEMLERRQNTRDSQNKPAYYAITAGEIEVYPTPDGSYTAELYYYSRLTALSSSANWLLTYFPDAYLYGSLVHAAPYLADDARISVWAALYQSAIDGINAESEQSKFGGSGRRLKIRSY